MFFWYVCIPSMGQYIEHGPRYDNRDTYVHVVYTLSYYISEVLTPNGYRFLYRSVRKIFCYLCIIYFVTFRFYILYKLFLKKKSQHLLLSFSMMCILSRKWKKSWIYNAYIIKCHLLKFMSSNYINFSWIFLCT